MNNPRSSSKLRSFKFALIILISTGMIALATQSQLIANAVSPAKFSSLLNRAKATSAANASVMQAPSCADFGFRYGRGFAPEPATQLKPISVISGDFNKDGKRDLIAANLFSGSISVLIGDGAGGFSMPNNIPVITNFVGVPGAVATADFNGDGNLDVAIPVIYDPGRVIVMNGDGTGNFTFANEYATGQNSVAITIADFNNDSKPDLAVANKGDGAAVPGNISVLFNDGSGGFAAAVNIPAGTNPSAIVSGDYTGDGKNDLAVANRGSGNVSILVNSGSGSFAAPVNIATGNAPSGIAQGFLNNDTRLDLAVSNQTDGTVSILLANNSGGFNAPTNFNTGPAPVGIAVNDFDSNGKQDLAITNSTANQTAVLLNNGSGGYGTPSFLSVGSEPLSIVSGDFNGDSKGDLAVANNASNNLSILLGIGNGTFGGTTFLLSNPQSVAISDYNKDGNLDFAVANLNADKVTIFLSDGAGGYLIPNEFLVNSKPSAIVAGDFNKDSKPDLAVANVGSADVTILLGDGSGNFNSAGNFGAASQPRSLAIADINKDGNLDIVTANEAANNVTLLRGNGDGTFAAPQAFTAGIEPVSIIIRDFNNDNNLDLAVANRGSSFVSILLGNGAGGFAAALNASLGAASTGRHLTAGDFNKDGKLDLAVSLNASSSVVILIGNGSGGFAAPNLLISGSEPRGLVAADLDGDTILDLAVTNGGDRNLSIFRGKADGTFEAQRVFDAGYGPIDIGAADLNKDQRTDLAVINSGSNSMSLLLNTCANTPPTITPSAAVTRLQGSPATSGTLAIISDLETAAGNLTIAATSLPAGLTVTNLANTNGTISATISADCATALGDKMIALEVTDAKGLKASANAIVSVIANTAPVLGNYSNLEIVQNASTTATPSAAPVDNGSIATVTVSASAGFAGTAAVNATTGVVTLTSISSVGLFTLTVTATDNCGAVSVKNFTVNVVPPVAITSLNPASKQALSGDFSLMVNGSGFTANSKVRWNGADRPTIFVSATKLTASINASDINSQGAANVTVFDPAAGGITSLAAVFTITPPNPVPTIAALAPDNALAGGAAFTLAINGTNFINGSVVKFNGADRATTFVSASQLTIQVAATDIANAGSATISVSNPAPGGGISGTANLAINNPAPGATTLNPSAVIAGAGNTTVLVNGSNFRADSKVKINGNDRATTVISGSQLSVQLLASELTTAGALSFAVFTPLPGGGLSPATSFTINNPAPVLASLNPASALAGGAAFTLTINGGNFINGSVVKFNNADRATTFVSASQLTIQITAADIANVGTAALSVFNPALGGGTSGTVNLAINNPAPGSITLNPAATLIGSPNTIVLVNGSNFRPDSIVRINGADRTTTVISTSQLSVQLLAAELTSAGTLSVTVFTPMPGGGLSPATNFTINNPAPAIATLNPATALAGDAAFVLTINGSNFINGSVVKFNNADRATTFVSASQLTIQVNAADLANAGSATISVSNPAPGGGISGTANLAINNPAPGAITLNPASVIIGAANTVLTINGSNFRPDSKIRINGADRTTTVISTTQLSVQLLAAELTSAGTLSVAVFNPTPGGGLSTAVNFTINNPTPVIASLSPASVFAGDAGFTLTLNGSNFISGSVVKFNNADRATTLVSASQLTIQITATDIANVGPAALSVFNPAPGGGTSNSTSLAINNPAPVLTSLDKISALLNSAATPLTLTGNKFRPNSVVRVNGADRPTTFTSATQLGITLTVADLATAGVLKLSVFTPTPGGGTSAELSFTVGNPIPTLASLTTTTALAGGTAFIQTLNGTGFTPASIVRINGADRLTTLVSGSQVSAQVTVADLANSGTVKFIVFNPAPAGGTSNELSMTVNNPPPTTGTLSQLSVTAGSGQKTLTINGTGFRPNSVVRVNGVDRVTTFISGTQLSFVLLPTDLTNAGTLMITVFTPAPGGGLSPGVALTVTNPPPSLISITPNSAFKGDPAFTMTVAGSSFVNGSIVNWKGSPRMTTFISSSQLTVKILESDLATAGDALVTVLNPEPGGGVSSALIYKVNPLIGTEADLGPRPVGDGNVGITDWILVGRLTSNIDSPMNSSEFQRADCAPISTFGDGRLSVSDWVQAGRYAVGLDKLSAAAGPSRPVTAALLAENLANAARFESAQPELVRVIRAQGSAFTRGEVNALPIEFEAQGDENALSFTLNFDPKLLNYASFKAPDGWAVNVNTKQAAEGRIGIMMALSTGKVVAAGKQPLLTLYFGAMGVNGNTNATISFDDQIFERDISDVKATLVSRASYEAANISISGDGVVNVRAASYIGPDLAGDSIASAFGLEMATTTAASTSLPLPTTLAGTTVKVTDSNGVERLAPLFFVSPSQINYLVPDQTAEGLATVTITNTQGKSAKGLLQINATAPSIFSADSTGKGVAAAQIVRVFEGKQNYEAVAQYDASQSKMVALPIDLGPDRGAQTEQVYLLLYGTGIRHNKDLNQVQLRIGSELVPVDYAGAQGSFAGLDQINARIPRSLIGRGEVSIELIVDGKAANTVKVLIR